MKLHCVKHNSLHNPKIHFFNFLLSSEPGRALLYLPIRAVMTPRNSRIMEMYDSGTVPDGTLSKSTVLLVQWMEERSGSRG